MVGQALIEFGAKPVEAITLIRQVRPAALNLQQATYLLNYKPTSVFNTRSGNSQNCCLTF